MNTANKSRAAYLAPGSTPVGANLPLAGKHALVTGGARGIGAACALALLLRGARVTLAGRDAQALQAAVVSMNAIAQPLGGAVAMQVLDVTDEASVRSGFAAAVACFGRVDILVNNAGQAAPAPFGKTDAALWQRMLDVNLTGTFHCTQAALPGMLEAKWGRIVNVASTAGLVGYRYVSAYVAAKHGVIGLTRALALEVATKGVTVNAVCPGYTETDIVREAVANIIARTGRSADEARAELAAGNPQKRLVQSEEVASAVAWLCLPEAGAMNGQSVAVAGGEVM
ncbi:SDR family NAD(P)-dependent oxidoreductase [Duganella violaceipulchra]|uniref:NAD(P)-dependent dehydrogenase (Short-subunit alcohol dehydrogenase family) n=1 Tax=Duganella violaceipulchra TaxID=2849652 RepID=A0ABT1GNS1_9BURK|nr:SDR family NAD(P)-dependent oxidoreductase [Duganella violaceicalia]MCP2010333.1 NAD(P)-dependent dehydrogenase (short-subunit alcohol dehydrogenase family) [Duganella violaceicalia]